MLRNFGQKTEVEKCLVHKNKLNKSYKTNKTNKGN